MRGPMSEVPPTGAHGGDGRAVAVWLGLDPDNILDLSQSLNPAAPDVGAVVKRHLDALGRYPDPGPATEVLGDAIGVERERVLLTNGASEAISLLGSVLGGRVSEPDFSLYPRAADAGLPLWRSNPHNPSGLLAAEGERAGVWDEAFYPLATGRWTRGDANCAVVGSLTKLFACPGLRAGYVIGDPGTIALCRRAQPAWSVSSLVCEGLPELLETADLSHWARAVEQLRNDLVGVLHAHGLPTRRSDANWVLVDSPGLRERLAPQGIVVRDCASFGMPGVARVAVPAEEGLARLDEALTCIQG